MLAVGKLEELFSDAMTVAESETANTAHLIRRLATLDLGLGNERVPGAMAVEVAQDSPHALDGGVDDGGARDADHAALPAEQALQSVDSALKHPLANALG